MMKTIKKALSVMLVVVIMLTAAPLSGFVGLELPEWLDFSITSSAAEASGTCGNNLIWYFDESTGTLTISGTGAMTNYSSSIRPWDDYEDNIKKVVIETGVTTIGYGAFLHCNNLTNVTIPDSVTLIDDAAFYNCTSLTSITIPDSIISIGYATFQRCTSLTNTMIPDSVTSIGDCAFFDCTSLANVTIGDSVTSIGNSTFYNCTSLTNITIGDSVTIIDYDAFSYCTSLTNITIPDGVTSIGEDVFAKCTNLTSVTLPDSLISIGDGAFYECTSLTDVYYNGTEEQWNQISIADYNAPLLNATIHFNSSGGNTPDDDEIASDKTGTCGDNLTWSLDNKGVLTISGTGNMYNWPDSLSAPWVDYRNAISSIVIGEGATSIGDYAFNYCMNCTSVSIPDTVTSIGNYAFDTCSSLTEIWIPLSVASIGDYAFYNCIKVTDVYFLGTDKQWNRIEIGVGNVFTTATMHFFTPTGGAIITGDFRCATSTGWNDVDNYQYSYSDEFFERETDEYYHDLALMSLALEASACVPGGAWNHDVQLYNGDYSKKEPLNANALIDNIGFGDFHKNYGYNSKPEFDSVACVVAAKNTYINDSDTTIIAIAVRGSGYEAEWGGNFRMGESTINHEGFDIAKSKVLANVEDFVSLYGDNFNSNIKIWITGYSRGAAIANLVASEFNKGKLNDYPNINSLDVTKDNVYAYCFATPKNTTDKEASSSKYNNIFSIVNPIDLVPYVAPGNDGFDFTRYGVTYFTPSMESTANYNGENGVLSQMSETHRSIYGTEYNENFTFYEFSYSYNEDTWYQPEMSFISENKSIGQTTYIDNLIDILAEEGFKNRENYSDNFEGAVIKLTASMLGGYDIRNNTELWDGIGNLIKNYFLLGKFAYPNSLKGLKDDLASIISTYTEISYTDALSALSELDDLLAVIPNHPNYAFTTVANRSILFESHKMHVYLSWMAYLDTDDNYKNLLSTTQMCRKIQINCPVNVNVYDSDGHLVASFIEDKVIKVEDESISAYIDENGQKCVILPFDDEYRIEITARDSCDVTVSVSEYNYVTSEDEKLINYYDVNIAKNETIECIAENDMTVNECEYPLTNSNGDVIQPDDIMEGDNIETYIVTTECNIDEINVLGGSKYTVGEFSRVTAIKVEGYNFIGWYNGDELVTTDYQYRFCVLQDVILTAVYEKSQEPIYNYTFSIQSPSKTEIRNKDGIILHANVEGTAPNGSYVKWESSNGNFDKGADGSKLKIIAKNKGYTTFTAILCDADGNELARDSVEMYSKSGLFDKIGGFFRSLFGETKIYES